MMPELLPVVQNDEQKFLSIITHRLPLADGPAAYSSFASRSEGMLKVMLRP
jgi:threonine dehydrogenase-like Zn-dependent dehydrogenase